MINQLTILIIHLIVALFLSYLAYSIIYQVQIPQAVGYFIAILAVAVVAVHIYFYTDSGKNDDNKNTYTKSTKPPTHHHVPSPAHYPAPSSPRPQHGINIDPKSKEFKPIGGVGGVTWIN